MKLFFIKFLAFYGACLISCSLQTFFLFSPVLATVTVGFVGSFNSFLAPIIYVGCFAAMSSPQYLAGHPQIFFISFIGTAIYLMSKKHLVGFGGKLGAIAFAASFLLVLTKDLW